MVDFATFMRFMSGNMNGNARYLLEMVGKVGGTTMTPNAFGARKSRPARPWGRRRDGTTIGPVRNRGPAHLRARCGTTEKSLAVSGEVP
jgi:hypothetical protein